MKTFRYKIGKYTPDGKTLRWYVEHTIEGIDKDDAAKKISQLWYEKGYYALIDFDLLEVTPI